MNGAAEQRRLARELLGKLDELLQVAYQRAQGLYEGRENGEFRPWAYRGLYVSKDQAEQQLKQKAAKPSLSATAGNPAALDAFAGAAIWGNLGRSLRLTGFDIAVTMIALAPEVDSGYGRLYAYLQDDVTRRRPTVNLALEVLAASADGRISERGRFLAGSPLIRSGLLTLVADASQSSPTLLDLYLSLKPQAVDHLLGQADAALGPFGSFEVVLRGEPLPEEESNLRALLPLLIDAKTYGKRLTLYFQGPGGMGQREAAQQLASSIEVDLVVGDLGSLSTHPEGFESELTSILLEGLLRECVVFLHGLDSLQDEHSNERLRKCMRALQSLPGPVVLSGSRPWAPPSGFADGTIVVDFPGLSVDARREAWRASVADAQIPVEATHLELLAQRYPLSRDQIRSSSRTVAARLRWNANKAQDDQPAVLQELMSAARQQCGTGLSALAQRIAPQRSWQDLVLPVEAKTQLRELCLRVDESSTVFDGWGFGRKLPYGKGVSALFTGPSGTGKTMAAEVIANALGLELFKIDLSQVVSKYIGQTEKNLESIFSAAERINAILFFDEADALFGKRSEIHDAHDRYANIEVGYLLQRMERYQGLAILATNLRGNLDDAFARRLAFAVQFPFPDEGMRHEIWTKVWPNRDLLDPEVDLGKLARHFKLSGGNITNVALAAAFLAAHERRSVSTSHLIQAIAREYQKVGSRVTTDELAARFRADEAREQVQC